MPGAPASALWKEFDTMGLLVLGYGIVAAGFYAFIAKTARPAPELRTVASVLAGPTVIDIADRIDRKAA